MPRRHRQKTEKNTPPCPSCGSRATSRKGKRSTKLASRQRWQCSVCKRRFVEGSTTHRVYPVAAILETITLHNLGYPFDEVARILARRFSLQIPMSTLHSWYREFKPLAPYHRLRKFGIARYAPRTLITSHRLPHRQVYSFRIHRAKLDLLFEDPPAAQLARPNQQALEVGHERLRPLRSFLLEAGTRCPHELFFEEHRASQLLSGFNVTDVRVTRKNNTAVEIARLALQTSPSNTKRHDTLQRFMLANDSVTVAVEVPVWLTNEDLSGLKTRPGFTLPPALRLPVTGHIDFVQVRNGLIHILDYKPNAAKERHVIEQLMIYALALSRRTGLLLRDFKCAWFDDKDYFEFYPLHAVYFPHK